MQRRQALVRNDVATTDALPGPVHRLNVGPQPGPARQTELARNDPLRLAPAREVIGQSRASRTGCVGMISADPTERIGLAVTRRLQQFLGTLALLFEIQAERRRAALGLGGACILRTIGQENPLLASASANQTGGWMSRRATLCERGRSPSRGHGGSDRAASIANQEARALV